MAETLADVLCLGAQFNLPQGVGEFGFPLTPREDLPMRTLGQKDDVSPEECRDRERRIEQ